MVGLRFLSSAALARAILAGYVPSAALRKPIRFAYEEAIGRAPRAVVLDASALESVTVEELVRAGAQHATLPPELEEASWWPAVIRPSYDLSKAASSLLFRIT